MGGGPCGFVVLQGGFPSYDLFRHALGLSLSGKQEMKFCSGKNEETSWMKNIVSI